MVKSILVLTGVILGASAWGSLAPGASVGATSQKCQIFFVPGAFATRSKGADYFLHPENYFAEYKRFFAEKGCKIQQGALPTDGTIEEQSLTLRDEINRFAKSAESGPIVLIAHSQGGLDARFALKTLKLEGVSALITIGSPHHGTNLADWVLRQREKRTLTYWLLKTVGGYDLQALRFAGEMTDGFLKSHASYFESVPEVAYASARGKCRTDCHWSLKALDEWVGIPAGDGLIPAESQAFGQDLGEYDLDHISEVDTDPGKRAERARMLEAMWEFVARTLGSTKHP